MPYHRLEYVVQRRALFFASIVDMDDELEGFLSDATVEQMRASARTVDEAERSRIQEITEHNLRVMRDVRRLIHVSCWHMNEHESAAMWKLYCDRNTGVAIQSRFSRLCEAFAPYPDGVPIGAVEYLDYRTEEMPRYNVFDPALRKRKSFEYEHELRAAVLDPQWGGIDVAVNLDSLIEAVYVCRPRPQRLPIVCALCSTQQASGTFQCCSLS